MTENEKQDLFTETDKLLEIFNKNNPIKNDGSFVLENVKNTALEMLDFAFKQDDEKESLKEWLEKSEFWTSPASAKYHGNIKGGLAVHSLLVTYQSLFYTKSVTENYLSSKHGKEFSYTAKDIFISAFAHDFCKAGSYKMESKRTKDFNGNWKYEPFYKVKSEMRNLGHGNESVLLLLESCPSIIKRRHVIEAISRHMGFSDLSPMETYNYSNFLQNPLVILLQLADQTAAQWWDI